MSAPYIIPFNQQPASSQTYGSVGGVAASYTIPAGKYARIGLKNTISVDIGGSPYLVSKNAIITTRAIGATSAAFVLDGAENVVSVDVTTSNTNAGQLLFGGYGESALTASTTAYHISKGAVASISKAFLSPRGVFYFAGISVGSFNVTALYLNIYNPPDFIWVNSGTLVNFTGNLTVELYNQIS